MHLVEGDLKVDMLIDDIPKSVMDDAGGSLEKFLIPILGQVKPDGLCELTPIGSGTLVRVDGICYILTASHVWQKTKQFENVHLVITDKRSEFSIPRDHIVAKELCNDQSPNLGPDLALLEIPQVDSPKIEAHKSFLNLSRQKDMLAERPPDIEKGLWAVTGLVGELTTVDRQTESRTSTTHAVGRALFTVVQQTHDYHGYDYFDMGAHLELDDVPKTFGGVSGGGLWQVCLSRDKTGKISWDGKRYFRGVAFWQSSVSDARRVIRCHGPKSIFDTAWTAWGLP